MLKANYHTHTELCGHAEGKVSDYVNEAIKAGFVELGLSDHAHTPEYFMSKDDYERNLLTRIMSDDDFENIYKPDVLKEKENKNIKVLLGLETEYVEEYHDHFEKLRKKLDYMIFGEHFFIHKGKVFCTYEDMDSDALEIYTDVAVKAMTTGLYSIFAHPDLFMYSYNSIKGFRAFDDICRKCSERIIEAAIKNNVYLEVNANGIQNTLNYYPEYTNYVYPREEFWKIVAKSDAKIIIGADAHTPSALDNEIVEKAIEFSEKMKLNRRDFLEI